MNTIAFSNAVSIWTLYKREVWRFMKVWNQTLLAPIITTLLFFAILTLAMGGQKRFIDGVAYEQFIVPGLIMMAIVQNAFANASSSLILAKIQGVIIDVLMPPFTGTELTFCYVAGGITRGILVGITVSLAMLPFVSLHVYDVGMLVFHLFAASMMLSLCGVLAGVWSQSFDQLSALTNYLVTPLSFLSGTFYSIHNLPAIWYDICHFNPFFYMIDGFRYALTGYHDGNLIAGVISMTACNLALWFIAQTIINKGYRLKS